MSHSRREQIESMLASEPDDPELRYMLAMEHVSGGEDAAAANCFADLVRRCPDYAPGYHQGARVLQRLDRIREARELLRRGIPVALAQQDNHTAGEMQQFLDMLELD
jgi:hypothetical protein